MIMMKKCDALCDAFWSGRNQIEPHLWLRNNTFYCRMELPRINGKRRYNRFSLHTSNYYEALEKMKSMSGKSIKRYDLASLYHQLKFVKTYSKAPSGNLGLTLEFDSTKLSSDNNPSLLKQILAEFIKEKDKRLDLILQQYQQLVEQNNLLMIQNTTSMDRMAQLIQENEKYKGKIETLEKRLDIIEKVAVVMPQITTLLEEKSSLLNTNISTSPSYTISEMLDRMLFKANNCTAEKNRKRNLLTQMIQGVGLKLEDNYSSLHKEKVLHDIYETQIMARTGVKGDNRNKWRRYLVELVTCACNTEPDFFKINVIANLPKPAKTKKSEKNPHLPYTEAELLNIFDPKHSFFKKNPDAFWMCMLGLFTGARTNAAMTPQFDDIIQKDGFDCIYYRENHPVKQFKNQATERIVPIHKQLLDLGFLDYVAKKKANKKTKGTDFIFPVCETKKGTFNNHYMTRHLFEFFEQIGVKNSTTNEVHDFHSFRKNASIMLQDAGVGATYINDIIGWEGKSTMEQSYSNHTLTKIKEQMDKCSYDFLQPHFDAWKKIMVEK